MWFVTAPIPVPTVSPAAVVVQVAQSPAPTPSPAAPPLTETLTDDELFERTFGRPRSPQGPQQIPVAFFVNGQEQGQLIVLLTPGSTPAVRIQAAPFLTKAAGLVRPEILPKLQTAVDAEGNLSLEALRENGLEAVFDERRLELQIQVPPAQRARNVIGGQPGLPPEAKNALAPSAISGFVNLRGGQDILWSGTTAATGRQPFRLSLEGALNVKGWVLEGYADFTEQADPLWVRGDLRLVRDDPAHAIRYLVGDLSLPVTGYETSIPMFGVTVARNFSLQPYLVTRPINDFQFFLEQPSRVEVYTNGRLIQVLTLPAGPQDIRDLPLTVGINDVQLVITDPVGRVQRLDFSTAVGGNLLAPGLQQFAYSLGFPSRYELGNRNYDWDRPVLTLSHRWGVTPNLTVGGYFQGDIDQQLIGLEGTIATAIGNFAVDTAISRANEVGTDMATRLRYEYTQPLYRNPAQRTFGFALEYRGANFTTLATTRLLDQTTNQDLRDLILVDDPRLDRNLDSLNLNNDVALDLTAYYSQRLFWDLTGRLNLRYQIGRTVPDAYEVALGLARSFRNGFGVSVTLSQSVDQMGQDEQRAFIYLSWVLPRQRQTIQASTDIRSTARPANRLTWNYSSNRTVAGLNASVTLNTFEDDYIWSGNLAYTGYRAQMELFQDVDFPRGQGELQNLTRFTFGTSLVFAGGQFGWSRPVTNSFALVSRRQTLQRQRVGVTYGSGNDYIARADALGGAVVPDLQAYRVSTLRIEAPNLPLGYEMGQDTFNLLPTYRSGTLIRVGTAATVFLRGTLLDVDGQPVSLQAGEVRSLTSADWQPATLFTNRIGRFGLAGFQPGRYELRLFSNAQAVIQFEIPPGKTGVYDVGELRSPVPLK